MRERVSVAETGQEAPARKAPVAPSVHAILALQRASGNYATTQLLRARSGASSAPGYTGGEDDYEDEFDEFDGDDESSQYLWKPHPITLGDFMGPALAEMEKRDAQAKPKQKEPEKPDPDAEAKARAEAKAKAKGEQVAFREQRKQQLVQVLQPHKGQINKLTALGYQHGELGELTAWKRHLATSLFTAKGYDVEISWAQNQLPGLLKAATATAKRLIALKPTFTSLEQNCNTLVGDVKVFDLACRKFEASGCNAQRLLTHLSIKVPGIQLLPFTCPQLVQNCTILLANVKTYHVDAAEGESTYLGEQVTTCMATMTSAIRILDSCRFVRCAPTVLKRLSGVALLNTCELATSGVNYSGNNRHHLRFKLKGWESIRGEGGAIVIFRFQDGVLEIGNTGQHDSAAGKSTYVLDEGSVPQTGFTDVLLFKDTADKFHLDAMK